MHYCKNSELSKKAEELVSFCKESVVSMYEWDDISGIILTGSFSRGEGSIIKTPSNDFYVLGDVEFMIVLSSNKVLAETYIRFSEIAKNISDLLLQKMIHCEVDLGPVSFTYFKNAKPKIFNIELKKNGKTVYGETDYLDQMPLYDVTDIPQEDAFNLLSNRIIEQLILYESLTGMHEINFLQANYQLTKLYLDIGGSLLAFTGNYETTYAKRLEKLKELSISGTSDINIDPVNFKKLYHEVENATRWKLLPQYENFFLNEPEMSNVDSKTLLINKLGLAINDVKILWLWEMKKLYSLNDSEDLNYTVNKLKRNECFMKKIKGWAKLMYLHIKYKKEFSMKRIIRLFFLGSPRSLVNICAAHTYFAINIDGVVKEESVQPLCMNRNILPVLYNLERKTDDSQLNIDMQNIIMNWQNYIKNF